MAHKGYGPLDMVHKDMDHKDMDHWIWSKKIWSITYRLYDIAQKR